MAEITVYTPTQWQDHIVDVITGQVIQEGTRFTASRMNNIEDGILGMYLQMSEFRKNYDKLMIQLELDGRAPANNGSFFDPLNGETPKALTLDTNKATLQTAIEVGTTEITLPNVPFKVGEIVTIFDDVNHEDVAITAIDGTKVTVSATVNAYKKGAVVSRSSAVIDTVDTEITFGSWGSFNITFSEVV